MKFKHTIFFIFIVAILIFISLIPSHSFASQTGTVNVSDSLNVRSGPDTSYSIIGKLYNGDKVTISQTSNNWGNITTSTLSGWVHMDYVILDETEPTPTVITHTVQSGETLYSIGQLYSVTSTQIKTWNNLTSDTIFVGQILYVSDPGTTTQPEKITFTNTTKFYSERDLNTYLGSFKPVTLEVLERIDNWIKVPTWKGEVWVIDPSTIIKEKIKFTEITKFYSERDLNTYLSSFKPITLEVIERDGYWVKVPTWKGEVWVVDKIKFTEVTKFYSEPNLNSYVNSFKPITLHVLKRHEEWVKVPTWLGEVWVINPNVQILDFFVYRDETLLRETGFYDLNEAINFASSNKPSRVYSKSQNKNVWMSTNTFNKIIIVDPGHGGKDDYTVGIDGYTREMELNLLYADKVKTALEKNGAIVHFTKTGTDSCLPDFTDLTLELQCRVDVAESYNADIFISLHGNYYPYSTQVRGTELFYNDSPYIDGDEAQNPYPIESKELATFVFNEIVSVLGSSPRGLEAANYYVNRHSPVPSILVEFGYMSNSYDLEEMKKSSIQTLFAQKIAIGVENYFQKYE